MENIASSEMDNKKELRRFDIYEFLFMFLLCGFLGFIFENIVVLVQYGKIASRGYWFADQMLGYYLPFLEGTPLYSMPFIWGLPIIEIYGIGGAIITVFFKGFRNQPIKLFLIGFFIMGILEYIGGVICVSFLGRAYWDYSHEFMNIQGHVCLKSAAMWGLLSLISVQFFLPFLEKIYNKERPNPHFKGVVWSLVFYAIFCALIKYAIDPTIIAH